MAAERNDDTMRIAERIRRRRLLAKLSQQVAADRAGIDRTYLSKIESGEAALDKRSTIEKIATALGCSYGDLTGQPITPDTPEIQAATAAVERIRVAFYSSSLQYGADVPARPLDAIRPEVDAAAAAWQECDYATAGRDLGGVLAELHAAARLDALGALRLLVPALDTAAWTSRVLGHYDLAHALASRSLDAASQLDDAALVGWATFTKALMTTAAAPADGQTHARRMLDDAIEALRPHADGDRLEVLGMLHLAAARTEPDRGDEGEYIAEARRIAARTGDGTAYRLYFGPSNVAIWRTHLAVERGDGGQVGEYATDLNLDAVPSRARRSMYHRHVGIGLSQERTRAADAVKALLRAERTAPGKLRLDPLARETVGHLLDRARAAAIGEDLGKLATLVGVI